ncbi:MAG: hypothetical protein ACOX87_10630 [Chloroflexota bacterium]
MDTSDKRALAAREAYVLGRIREHGAFTCTGGCEQRQSGQLHCVHLARELGTSNQRIWRSVGILAEMGLLTRVRDEVERCWRFLPAGCQPSDLNRRPEAPGHADGK